MAEFDGSWTGGRILGNTLVWENGTETTLEIVETGHAIVKLKHESLSCWLREDGKLLWADGDLWVKEIEFSVTLDKRRGESWGLEFGNNSDTKKCCIMKISTGLAMEWNHQNPQKAIKIGDEVIEVNGVRGDRSSMEVHIWQASMLKLILCRRQASLAARFEPGLKVGIRVLDVDGVIASVHRGSMADKAGVRVGMQMLTIDGRPFTVDRWNAAVGDNVPYRATFSKQADGPLDTASMSMRLDLAEIHGITYDFAIDVTPYIGYPWRVMRSYENFEGLFDTLGRPTFSTAPFPQSLDKMASEDSRYDFGFGLGRCSYCKSSCRNRGDEETRTVYCSSCYSNRFPNARVLKIHHHQLLTWLRHVLRHPYSEISFVQIFA